MTNEPKSIALGTFDGFHRGHKAVIEKTKEGKYPPYILLFPRHPQEIITGRAPAELLTDGARSRLLTEYKIKPIYTDFEKIYRLSPEEFFEKILVKELNARELSCGKNYTFGSGAEGTAQTLERLCKKNGIVLRIAETVRCEGEPISSTRIRRAIEDGDVEKANEMLGRPFSYGFTVVHGDARGRTLGFPTLNQIIPDGFVKLKYGVYASAVYAGGSLHSAVTNYGVRPTVGGDRVFSETHIADFSGDLYGKSMEIYILSRLRPEKRFGSFSELSRAISADAEQSLKIFNNSLALFK